MSNSRSVSKFQLGKLIATGGAVATFTLDEIQAAVRRHAQGDWGDLDPEDWAANERALQYRGRLLSVYHSSAGVKFWVITEHDRSATTVLLPSEY